MDRHKKHKTRNLLWRVVAIIVAICNFPFPIVAQDFVTNITSSGLNTETAPPTTNPDGQIVHDITGGTRPGKGQNLFHSFGQFSVGENNVANFANDTGLATENILSRVTGGTRSDIFGTIRTTGFPGAELFLMNPAGILFGPNASLDVQGAFHATTADFIRLTDGTRFDAASSAQDVLLTTAPPEAFGFLGQEPAAISVQGSFLEVAEGETLSVVGGDIEIVDGALRAPGGRANLVSVASPGEVVSNESGQGTSLDVDSFNELGDIEITRSSEPLAIDGQLIGNVDTSGEGGGTVSIRGGRLSTNNAWIFANTLGDVDGAPTGIDIQVRGEAVFANNSILTTNVLGAGDAGNIQVTADRIVLNNRASLESILHGPGDAGNIQVTADRIVLNNRAALASGAFIGVDDSGKVVESIVGRAGNIYIVAGQVRLLGNSQIISFSFSEHAMGGDIVIEAEEVRITEARLGLPYFLTAFGIGSGDVTVIADESIIIEGIADDSNIFDDTEDIVTRGSSIKIRAPKFELKDGLISSRAVPGGTAPAGDITIDANHIRLVEGSSIFSAADEGDAGKITAKADESITIEGSSIFSSASGDGNAGKITVKAEESIAIDGGEISTSAVVGSGDAGNIDIDTPMLEIRGGAIQSLSGQGKAGDIHIVAGQVRLLGRGAISAFSFSGIPGDIVIEAEEVRITGARLGIPFFTSFISGDVTVTADESIIIEGDGIITGSGRAEAGSIKIRTPKLELKDGFISSASGSGSMAPAGDITIDANHIRLVEGSQISARTLSDENAGKITVKAGESITIEGGGVFTETLLGSGDAGNIDIDTSVLEIRRGIISSASNLQGTGKAGDIIIEANRIRLLDSGRIQASAFASSIGGLVRVDAAESITIDGLGSSIGAASSGAAAGSVEVNTESLEVRNNAAITASAFFGIGRVGGVTINAKDIQLSNQGTISAESRSPDLGASESGRIFIQADDTFRLSNGSSVSVKTAQANAGDINIEVGSLLHLRDKSSITTTVANGQGDGGNINIDPVFVVLDGGSEIVAKARAGAGGNVNIRIVGGGALFQSTDSVIDASSELGVAGSVVVDAPDSDIISGLQELPENLFDAATVMKKPCAQRSGADVIELAVRRYEVLPDSPYALRVPDLDPTMEMDLADQSNDQRQITSPEKLSRLAITCPDND